MTQTETPKIAEARGMLTVDRRSGLTQREFVNEYRNPGKPVIFTDLSKDWQASNLFSLDFFAEQYGDRQIEVKGQSYTLRQAIALLKNSSKETPAPYPMKLNLRDEFADLRSYVQPRPAVPQPDRTHNPLLPKQLLTGLHDLEIFLGGPGGDFPYVHYDYLGLYAFINQLYGDKEFTLFSPDQQPYLYPKPGAPWISQIPDFRNPDLEKYPLFANATPTTIVISAGESVFIPYGWYHTARSLTLTVSVAFDQLCQSNWNFFIDECVTIRQYSPLKAKIVRSYLSGIGALMSAYESVVGTP